MAAANGREGAGLSGQLLREPYRFDFFQAVRLLERLAREVGADDPSMPRLPVGQDGPPHHEAVRFRAQPTLGFPASPVARIDAPPANGRRPGEPVPPPEMTVTFLGLTGPLGVLPQHYTALLLRRLREKDFALRDWLDLFNHRAVSLFYRAWEKYRLPASYERSRLSSPAGEPDPVTRCLHSLVGLGTAGLRGRLKVADEAVVFYAGHFAHYPRSACALEGLVEEHFGLPVGVLQAHGQWLTLEPGDHSLLPGPEHPLGRHNRLGEDLVVGERVWDVQGKFRLRVGPLTYGQFRELLPGSGRLGALCQMTRLYVGPELEFDVQLVLLRAQVPACRVGADGPNRPYLGWNTWVGSNGFARDADDAVFASQTARRRW
jgi:type VI secretion system protein ImpH